MILTSVCERSARGSAAETAASPPTRTKSSISVVTNRTRKRCPRSSPMFVLCKKGSKFSHQQKAMPHRGERPNALGIEWFDLDKTGTASDGLRFVNPRGRGGLLSILATSATEETLTTGSCARESRPRA
ncbi:hypothetical protein BRAS3809_1680002 [Bradyrhizobium sp. STM 3809]|nr:hypothetical protein BRAS3809_1680002 [Bradyrhizobium sp. STM 3809]